MICSTSSKVEHLINLAYYFKWLSIAHEMEKHIKAIIYDRAIVQPDLVTFINKRIVPYME